MNKREKRKIAKQNAHVVAVQLLVDYLRQGAPYENNEDDELAELEDGEIKKLIDRLERAKS